ncbi:MAG: glycosyltransferase, partial [Oscillospiraceae bacterium]|nr:glycosyltransferase [Oscillospiraceae bacterium]
MNQARPLVSLLVVAYQAAACLPDLLADLRAQDYPAEALEAVLVDGLSPDGTKALMLRFAATAPMPVRVLDNPGRSLACGCNVALAASRGDLLVRLDAHARIPSDFITRNVEAMTPDRDIVGGKVEAFSPHTPWEAVLVALDTSRFAGGAAAFRNAGRLRAVDTLAYAM